MAESTGQRSNRDDALAIVRRLREAGHIAYFAGGCVRDMLLGLDAKDYDIATDAPPPRVREIFTNTQAVGAAFGVILVRHGKSVIEVATFRTDLKYVDGRRPEGVVFTTAEEDAKRRDFTINGMFFDPIENRVIDFVGGQEDLKNKVLRAIGEPMHRIEEDRLRMLRAVRFAARFDLTIEQQTADAIRHYSHTLRMVSPERIAEELRLTLCPPTRVRARDIMRSLRLGHAIFDRISPSRRPLGGGTGQAGYGIFKHTAPGRTIPFSLAMASAVVAYAWPRSGGNDIRELLTHAHTQRIVRGLRRSLRLSNEELEGVHGTIAGAGLLLNTDALAMAQLKRFLARPTAALSREFLRAMRAAGFHAEQIAGLEARLSELDQTNFAPAPLITGDDLTAEGLTPGPVFKRLLDAVYDAQLEDRVNSKDEAMKLALALAKG